MNKVILYIICTLFSLNVLGQNDKGVKKMITMSDKDTLVIKEFNSDNKLVFHKIFPQYGVAQILGYSYSGSKLKSYTWSHSNSGFIEHSYEYDTLRNIIKTFSYKKSEKKSIPSLMSYYSVESLKNSTAFIEYAKDDNRFLASIQYLEDTLVTKEVEYNYDNSIKNTIYFYYESGLLKRKKEVYGHNNAYNEILYTYDNDGNEIQWLKRFGSSDNKKRDEKMSDIFGSTDTPIIYNKVYENNLLKEVIGNEDGEISSRKIYSYSDDKLLSIVLYNSTGEIKISSVFHYNENNTVNYKEELNKYMGQRKTTYYYY